MRVSRRSFLKLSGISLAALPFASALVHANPKAAADANAKKPADLPLLPEDANNAKALKYCHDGDKPNQFCPQRKEKDRKGQHCYNCQLYTKTSGEKKDEVGKCLLFPKNVVKGEGWCMSWVKNPKAANRT